MSTTIGNMKKDNVGVRKRTLEPTKPLTIIRSREELKKLESSAHHSSLNDESKYDEGQELAQRILKKKFEILVPEIGQVTEAHLNTLDQSAKPSNNEESGSTAMTVNGANDQSTKSSQGLAPGMSAAQAALLSKGLKPGQVACGSDMSKGTSQAMRDSQIDNMQYLNYKPIFKMPAHYIKYREPVYEGFESFTFEKNNYELTEKDLAFYNTGALEGLSAPDFERVIDIFEKIVVLDKNQSLMHLKSRFEEKAPADLCRRVKVKHLEDIYQKYWKSEREKRKHSFLRMFWEKADIDDNDQNAAFRKRHKDKMKLRKKTKQEIEQYFKMFELRTDSVNVLQILRSVYMREELKRKKNMLDWLATEVTIEQNLKEKGIQGAQFQKMPKIDLKKIEASQVDDILEKKVADFKNYHEKFLWSSQQYMPERAVTLDQSNYFQSLLQANQNQTPQKEKRAQKTLDPETMQIEQPQNLMPGPKNKPPAADQRIEPTKITIGQGRGPRAGQEVQKQSQTAATTPADQSVDISIKPSESSMDPQNRGLSQKAEQSKEEGRGQRGRNRKLPKVDEGHMPDSTDDKFQPGQPLPSQTSLPSDSSQTQVYPSDSTGNIRIPKLTATDRQRANQPIPISDEAICSMDQITIISMLLQKRQQMGISLGDKFLKMDVVNQKELKEKIESMFEKPRPKSEDEDMEIDDQEDRFRNESTMEQSTVITTQTRAFSRETMNQQLQFSNGQKSYYNQSELQQNAMNPFYQATQQQTHLYQQNEMQQFSGKISQENKGKSIGSSQIPAKTHEQIKVEEEFQALINRNFMVRRGRNNRILVKLIEKNVFEQESGDEISSTNADDVNSINIQDGTSRKQNQGIESQSLLKKRKKSYYETPLDFVKREMPEHIKSQYVSLLNDRRFMRKRLKRTHALYVTDHVKTVVTKQLKEDQKLQQSRKLPFEESKVGGIPNYGNESSKSMESIGFQPLVQDTSNAYDSEEVVAFCLRNNLKELMTLAEGVGEWGDIEAFIDSPQQMEDFQRQQAQAYKSWNYRRMQTKGSGAGIHSNLYNGYSQMQVGGGHGNLQQPNFLHQISSQSQMLPNGSLPTGQSINGGGIYHQGANYQQQQQQPLGSTRIGLPVSVQSQGAVMQQPSIRIPNQNAAQNQYQNGASYQNGDYSRYNAGNGTVVVVNPSQQAGSMGGSNQDNFTPITAK